MTIPCKKNAKAIALLESWLADESGYDEKTWPRLKRSIERNRLSYRRRFSRTGPMSWLCKLGFHSWLYISETSRYCSCCPKHQIWGWSVLKDRACWR